MNDILKNSLTAHYTFEDASNPGKDSSGNGFDAAALGTSLPAAEVIDGKNAVRFAGGKSGTSYLKLPSDVLKNVSDMTGITLSAWVRPEQGTNVWERLFDFGKGMYLCQKNPSYLLLCRGGYCCRSGKSTSNRTVVPYRRDRIRYKGRYFKQCRSYRIHKW